VSGAQAIASKRAYGAWWSPSDSGGESGRVRLPELLYRPLSYEKVSPPAAASVGELKRLYRAVEAASAGDALKLIDTTSSDYSDPVSRWQRLDFVAAAGGLAMAIGFVLALCPSLQFGGVLFPIGAALVAFVAYRVRGADGEE
jgi:hypothetical protein